MADVTPVRRRRQRVVLAVAGIVVIVAAGAGVFALLHRDAATPAATHAASQGFVFIGGQYVASPYAAAVAGDSVTINGAPVVSIPVAAGHQASNPAKDALDVVAMGDAEAQAKGAATVAERSSLVADMRADPAVADVAATSDDVTVTDTTGNSATLLLNPHVADSGLQHAALSALAAEWNSLLASGGLLLASQGVYVEAGPSTANSVVSDIAAAFTGPASARQAALENAVGAPTLATALLAAGPPPRAFLAGAQTQSTASAIGSDAETVSRRESTVGGIQTPGSARALILDYFGEGDDSAPRKAAVDEGYTVVTMRLGGEKATGDELKNFLVIARTGVGVFYAATHGSGTGIVVEKPYARNDTRSEQTILDAAKAASGLTGAELSIDRTGLLLTTTGITNHWTDQSSIVFLAACGSWPLHAVFNAREFVGPSRPTDCGLAKPLAYGLFSRLEGTTDSGTKRLFSDAFTTTATKLGYPHLGVQPTDPKHVFPIDQTSADGLTVRIPTVGTMPQPITTLFVEGGGKGSGGCRLDVASVDLVAHTVTLKEPVTKYFAFITAATITEPTDLFYYAGNGNTVLAPSISVNPLAGPLQPGSQVQGTVVFDAAMDTTVSPRSVIEATGSCSPEIVITSVSWTNSRSLAFAVIAHAKGTATFTIRAANAKSAQNQTLLDGNGQPSGKNRMGPAGDNYTWSVACVTDLFVNNVPVSTDCSAPLDPSCRGVATSNLVGSILTVAPVYNDPTVPGGCNIQTVIGVTGIGEQSEPYGSTQALDFGAVHPGYYDIYIRFTGNCAAPSPGCTIDVSTQTCDGGLTNFDGQLIITTNSDFHKATPLP